MMTRIHFRRIKSFNVPNSKNSIENLQYLLPLLTLLCGMVTFQVSLICQSWINLFGSFEDLEINCSQCLI